MKELSLGVQRCSAFQGDLIVWSFLMVEHCSTPSLPDQDLAQAMTRKHPGGKARMRSMVPTFFCRRRQSLARPHASLCNSIMLFPLSFVLCLSLCFLPLSLPLSLALCPSTLYSPFLLCPYSLFSRLAFLSFYLLCPLSLFARPSVHRFLENCHCNAGLALSSHDVWT